LKKASALTFIAFVVACLLIMIAGCGGSGGSTTGSGGSTTVKITASGFQPDHITVKAGTSVTFENTTDSGWIIQFPDTNTLYSMGPNGTTTHEFSESCTVGLGDNEPKLEVTVN
jgi:plastocyanin